MSATIPSTVEPLKFSRSFKPYYTPAEMLQLGVFGGTALFEGSVQKRLGQKIVSNLITGLTEDKYNSSIYVQYTNYFKTFNPVRNRLNSAPIYVKTYSGTWFDWYCMFYYNPKSIPTEISNYRISQWQDELNTFSFYIERAEYTPPNPNPQNLNRYTDPTFLPLWKQYMLEFAWDPTIKPGS